MQEVARRSTQEWSWLGAQGEMADRVRSHDWASTPLGSPDNWPSALRSAVSLLLEARIPMFVWWGPEHLNIYNDAYVGILGPDKHPHLLGHPARDMWNEIWDVVGPLAGAVLSSGAPSYFEDLPLFMVRRGFLEETYFTFSYSAIRDEEGAIRGMFCACQETTSQVLTQRRLNALRELGAGDASNPAQAASDAIAALATDPQDIPFAALYLLEENGRTAKLSATHAVSNGTPLVDVSSWPFEEVLRSQEPRRVEGLRARFARDLPRSPWEEMPDSTYVAPLRRSSTESPIGAIILGISPRREFDERYRDFFNVISGQIATRMANARFRHGARKARERLQRLFMEAPVGIALLEGPEHVFSLANRAYFSIVFGDGARDIVGKTVRQAFPELEGESFFHLLDEVYRTGKPYVGNEIPLSVVLADGTRRNSYITFIYQPKHDESGIIEGIVAICYDVTEHVLARRETEEALKARDEFLSIASHELKTPLAVIKLQAQIAQRGLERDPTWAQQPGRVRKLVDQTDSSVRRLTRLVDDMLDISRIATGKLSLQLEEFDLVTLARDVIEHLQGPAQSAGVAISLDAPKPLVGRWDRFRLEQVITNLLTNAIRYGEGTPVEIRADRMGDRARLMVRDRGPGIALEDHDRIFQRFERGIENKSIVGLGLGLFICREIVARHHGDIRVESEQGHGANFIVEIPFEPVQTAGEPSSKAPFAGQGNNPELG